jgi:hypothetical protein
MVDEAFQAITVVMEERVLSIEVSKANWLVVYHALEILINYYQVIKPDRDRRNHLSIKG